MADILADDIFKCIFLNENLWISIKISPKFVTMSLIDNEPALAQVMVTEEATSHSWTNASPMHRRIYAALGEDELTEISENLIHTRALGWQYI